MTTLEERRANGNKPLTFPYFHSPHIPVPQSKQSSSYSDRDTTEEDSESLEDMDFLSRQKKLQAEAKLALAMAKPMAKMQVEVEKQNRKKSPVADLVSTVAIGNGPVTSASSQCF